MACASAGDDDGGLGAAGLSVDNDDGGAGAAGANAGAIAGVTVGSVDVGGEWCCPYSGCTHLGGDGRRQRASAPCPGQ
jgi:hypothetical protein